MTTSYNTCTKPLKNSLNSFHLGYCLIVQTDRTRGYNRQEQVPARGSMSLENIGSPLPTFSDSWRWSTLAYDPREGFFFPSSVYNHIKEYSSSVIIDSQQSQFTPLTDSPAEMFFIISATKLSEFPLDIPQSVFENLDECTFFLEGNSFLLTLLSVLPLLEDRTVFELALQHWV